jgi:hypothetical protein
MTNHPITPPPELVQQWWEEADQYQDDPKTYFDHVATEAARWGADQELEACCASLLRMVKTFTAAAHLEAQRRSDELRTARRPKPPSLKKQALAALRQVGNCEEIDNATFETIRKALEALPND